MQSTDHPRESAPAWRPFVWIIAASALAHLWCLGSRFYLDDQMIIEHNAHIISGDFWTQGTNAWTFLWYVVQHRLFGISTPGFHLVNWLLHTAVACVLFPLGRDLLRGRGPEGIALFAAVLFAVHPLGSEIPNYARTQDLAWVTLFSLIAAWRTLRLAQGGGWWNALWAVLAVFGAMFSKGPGLLHALMMVIAVSVAFLKPEYAAFVSRRRWLVGALFLALMGALLLIGKARYSFHPENLFGAPRFVGQAYTLGRVFWEFAWRAVVPISLSADHHIAETLVPPGVKFWKIADTGSMWAAAALLALTAFSLFLAWKEKTRIVGVCLFLFCATILFRVLYLVPEFMPEYRIYPGLPWFCLGAAVTLHALVVKCTNLPPRVPGMIVIAVFTILSARRSFVWHDYGTLLGDVLQQYPTQARALWEFDDRDAAAGNWQAIIDRQTRDWPEVFRRFMEENKRLAPARELPTGHFALAEVACRGSYALALAHTQNTSAGFREINQQEIYMRRLGLDPVAHLIHWGYFYYYKAQILKLAGKDADAIALLETKGVPRMGKLLLKQMQEKKAAAR